MNKTSNSRIRLTFSSDIVVCSFVLVFCAFFSSLFLCNTCCLLTAECDGGNSFLSKKKKTLKNIYPQFWAKSCDP